MIGVADTYSHESVLLKEALGVLRPKSGEIVLDGTIGPGGHAREIVRKLMPDGLLIGMDKDEEVLKEARRNLGAYKDNVRFFHNGFEDCAIVLEHLSIEKVNGVLLDLGLSSFQLESPWRGFSFLENGPLDMRMDRSCAITAADVVNSYSREKLYYIFKNYGEERYARKITRAIIEDRAKNPFTHTGQLSELIKRLTGGKSFRIHPATRIFQALRIEVNRELEALESFLKLLPEILAEGGRAAIISFHSLEDRLVKNCFREGARLQIYRLLNKKPIVPGEDEIRRNSRSRSAKLRGAERIKKI